MAPSGTRALFALFVTGLVIGPGPRWAAADSLETLSVGPGFALVELFTSQGCSSCPPADRVLARLAAISEEKDLPVYPLSMHVDYWNRLGWRDPFSQARFSARQQRYARVLGTGAYTPQVIVNGLDETVGSREEDLAERIAQQVSREPAATIALEVDLDGTKLRVRPTVHDAPEGATTWLALTRRSSGNHVPAGENAGRDLRHAHVVLVLEEAPPGEPATLELPAGLDAGDAAVTAFLQDPRTLRVLAATRARVSARGADSPDGAAPGP